MKLPRLAIENYQFVLVLVFIALSTGLLSFFSMPRSEDPVLDGPFYTIVAVYPGTSPKDMEELIVDPLEDELNEIEDLDEIKSTIEEGLAVISVEASYSIDFDEKYDEVVSQINSVKSELPAGLFSLEVNQFSPFDVVILQLAMSSETATYRELVNWSERLEDRLEKVTGVRGVEIEGYPEEEIRVSVDMEKMAQMNIPLNLVMGILEGTNAIIPGGDINLGQQNFSVKTSGGFKSLRQLRNTVITAREDQIVYLKDIAEVGYAYEDETYLARHDGNKAVFVSVTQKEGFNVLEITSELDAEIQAFQGELPLHLTLKEAFKQGPAVAERIDNFFTNLMQGIALVGLIILIFLGLRNSLIIMTVIPTSIIIAINLLDVSGFGLQQISIAGLVIALGLLVDNGIVVVENINRYLNTGLGLREAAIKGTTEVGWAIVSSTATTILAFFPMSQLGGGTGMYLRTLPLIVIFSLVASLILALALTPLLASKLLKVRVSNELGRAEKAMKWVVEKGYRRVLNAALTYPRTVVAASLLLLVGSGLLFPIVGVSFFPTADKPMLLIDIDTPKGTNLRATGSAVQYAESLLDSMEFVSSYASNIGHGNPQIYYNIIPENYKKNYGQILVNVEEWNPEKYYALMGALRHKLQAYPGARFSVSEFKNGPPYEAPIELRIVGEDPDTLKSLSAQVELMVAATTGVINVDNPIASTRTDLKVEVNEDKAAMLGLRTLDIDQTIRTAINGAAVGTINTEAGEEYDLVIRMPTQAQPGISDFQKIHVASVTGVQVPLRQIARLGFQPSASKIDHYNLQRAAIVTADVLDGFETKAVTEDILTQLESMQFPTGYGLIVGGEYETQQESFGDLGQLLIVAILGILAVLILQFRSFLQPMIVLSAIPLAFTGSIAALYVTGYSFSFFAFVGFTSLIGIVVNTSIILVDYANQLREQGMTVSEALRTSAETRFTPILLTTMTTILGLLPLTLTNSTLWSPLGWTIIGGMISSTLLTLLIVPILYQWFTRP